MAPEPVGGWGEVAPPTGGTPPGPPPPPPTGRGHPATRRTAPEILDDTFRAVRGALPTLLVAAGVTVSLLGLVNLLVLLPLGAPLRGTRQVAGASLDPDLAAEALWFTGVGESASRVLVLAGALLVSGVLAPAGAAGLAGRTTSPGALWNRLRGRLLPLLLAASAPALVVAVAALVGAAPGSVLALLAARAGAEDAGPRGGSDLPDGPGLLEGGELLDGGAHAAGVLAGVGLAALGGLLLGSVAVVWVGVRWCLAPQAVALEGLGARAALRRSAALTRGSSWRTLGVLVFAAVLTWVVHALVSAPFATVGAVLAASRDADIATVLGLSTGQLLLSTAGTVVAATASYPLLSAALTVLFDDLRSRVDQRRG